MHTSLTLFGRAPVPGRTKTRLIPARGAGGAAELYAAFVRDVVRTARGFEQATLSFWSADDDGSKDSARLDSLTGGMPRCVQPEGDLGARMLAALEAGQMAGQAAGQSAAPAALVIGTDAPTLPLTHLASGREALQGADIVLGPSSDGGYYLIGARRTAPGMFDGVRFSTRYTLADTRRACAAAGLSVALLSPWYDVDTPADLALLRAHLTLDPEAAPHTASALLSGE